MSLSLLLGTPSLCRGFSLVSWLRLACGSGGFSPWGMLFPCLHPNAVSGSLFSMKKSRAGMFLFSTLLPLCVPAFAQSDPHNPHLPRPHLPSLLRLPRCLDLLPHRPRDQHLPPRRPLRPAQRPPPRRRRHAREPFPSVHLLRRLPLLQRHPARLRRLLRRAGPAAPPSSATPPRPSPAKRPRSPASPSPTATTRSRTSASPSTTRSTPPAAPAPATASTSPSTTSAAAKSPASKTSPPPNSTRSAPASNPSSPPSASTPNSPPQGVQSAQGVVILRRPDLLKDSSF